MGAFASYSQQVEALVPAAAWDETYFSLISLKHALQGVPGCERIDIWANRRDDGRVHLIVGTLWEYAEQMDVWLHSNLTVEGVLKGCTPPPELLQVRFGEEIG